MTKDGTMDESYGRFRAKHFDRVESLLEYLAWAGRRTTFWYRGVRDVRFGLVPAALRESWLRPTVREQRDFELGLLHRFAAALDRAAIVLPGAQSAEELFDGVSSGDGQHEYPARLLRLAALGQHHGLPTRLLDWTTDPYVALWFAASSARDTLDVAPNARLAVWLLDATEADHSPWHRGPAGDEPPARWGAGSDLWAVRVPRVTSPFLHAQHGVFTVRAPPEPGRPSDDAWSTWWVHERDLVEPGSRARPFGGRSSDLHRVLTLPVARAANLLSEIESTRGISRSTLMPDVASCVAETLEVEKQPHRRPQSRSVSVDVNADLWSRVRGEAERRGGIAPSEVHQALLRLLPRGLGGRRPSGEHVGWSDRTPVVDLLDAEVPGARRVGEGPAARAAPPPPLPWPASAESQVLAVLAELTAFETEVTDWDLALRFDGCPLARVREVLELLARDGWAQVRHEEGLDGSDLELWVRCVPQALLR